MAAGLISKSDFVVFAYKLVDVSEEIRDNWQIRNVDKDDIYLYKKIHKAVKLTEYTEAVSHDDLECDQLEEDDILCVTPSSTEVDNATTIYVFEYHVIYSNSYCVPVLYFNVYRQDGRLVSLEEIWQRVPEHYKHKLEGDRWSFLTQQEHPLLGRPFYQLHPCHTADLMKQVQESSSNCERNYLISWLSAVGPVVGLDMPLAYGKLMNKDPT